MLTHTHIVPDGERACCGVATEEKVTAHPTQQPVVGGAQRVGLVDLQRRERRDVDLVQALGLDHGRVGGVERVDPLQHQNGLARRRQLQGFARRVAVARFHVIHRCHHLLASQQRVELLVEVRHVHRVDRVVVHVRPLLAQLVQRLLVERQVVVVYAQRNRVVAVVGEVHGQLGGESCFPGRGGSGDADDAHGVRGAARRFVARADCLGDGGELGLLAELGVQVEVDHLAPDAFERVQLAQRVGAVHAPPCAVVGEGGKQRGRGREGAARAVGLVDDENALGHYAHARPRLGQRACAAEQREEAEARAARKLDHLDLLAHARLEQRDRRVHAMLLKVGQHLAERQRLAREREVAVD
mmetsp:Transcript_39772/g.92155  ORF Transcript_39772/g.92155 Transcript_39772/m.92155 type:complete len:356 (+) Transcript_39772:419-1486(+)